MPSDPKRERRLVLLFARVRSFVARRAGNPFAGVTADWCASIRKGLSGGAKARAYMCVGHHGDTRICMRPGAERLDAGTLLGLFLHEFGHVATGGDDRQADAWVFEKLGLVVSYRGRRLLQWVSPAAARSAGI